MKIFDSIWSNIYSSIWFGSDPAAPLSPITVESIPVMVEGQQIFQVSE